MMPFPSMRAPYPTPYTTSTNGFSSRFVPLQPPPSATQSAFAWASQQPDDGSGSASPHAFHGSYARAQTVALAPPTHQLQPPREYGTRHRSATPTLGSRTSFAHPSGNGLTSLPPLRHAYPDYPPTRSGLGIFVPTYDNSGEPSSSFGGYDPYAPLPSPIYRAESNLRTPSDASFPFQPLDSAHALRGGPPPPTPHGHEGFALNPRALHQPMWTQHAPQPPLPSPAYTFGRPSSDALLAARPSMPMPLPLRSGEMEADAPSQHYTFPAHLRPST